MGRKLGFLAYLIGVILIGILCVLSTLTSDPFILFSSFSPPASLQQKDNPDQNDTCTDNGNYLWLAMKLERDEILRRAEEAGENLTKDARLFRLYPPVFTCPYKIEKFGGMTGSGKYVCGAKELYGKHRKKNERSSCVVYSFGINYDVSFDMAIIRSTNCLIFAYDHTVDFITPLPGRMMFEKIGLTDYGTIGNFTFKTLKQLMTENGHEWIDILKVDVEGSEFDALNMVMDDFEELPFAQLLVEIHVNPRSINQIYSKAIPMLNRLESKGLRVFHAEPNDGAPQTVFEYSFINGNVKEFRNYTMTFFSSRWSFIGPIPKDWSRYPYTTLDLDGLLK